MTSSSPSSPRPITSLDDLFADSMAAARSRPMRNARVEPVKSIPSSSLYSLPEFWEKRRVIALVHLETKTLLGTYQEFVHKREPNARKLELLETPAPIQHTEYASGTWYLGDDRVLASPERWTSERILLLEDLVLEKLRVHAELVEVKVCLQFGGIGRVELTGHTTFHSPDGKNILTLPIGTNLLECMSLEGKIELRKELQR